MIQQTHADATKAMTAIRHAVKQARAALEAWAKDTYPTATTTEHAMIVDWGLALLAERIDATPETNQ